MLGLAIAWVLGEDDVVAVVGDPAPDFTVELLDGGTFALADHQTSDGRPLIVNLWASWCVPCREEMPTISDFAEDHPEVAVLGVAVQDARSDSVEFAEEVTPSYPLAFGDDTFEAAYPSIGLPATYLIGGDGTVTAVHNGILDEEALQALVSTGTN